MKYISIDGDDVGRRITACYISNDEKELQEISKNLELSIRKIASLLVSLGFNVLFCAADGVVASTEKTVDFTNIFEIINSLAPKGISYSAGVGDTLREAYIALQAAKSNGKNCLYEYSEISTKQGDNAT